MRTINLLFIAIVMAISTVSMASVSILLHDSYVPISPLKNNHSGHVAMFLSNTCIDTNHSAKLRLCDSRDAAHGVVINRIPRTGKFNWLAIPLLPYLYAVDSVDQIPLMTSDRIADLLSKQSFRTHLVEEIGYDQNGEIPKYGDRKKESNWHNHFAQSMRRNILAFELDPSVEKEKELIEWLNKYDHSEKFSLYWRNCSDFVRKAMNVLFDEEGSGRNRKSDWIITSPKGMAQRMAKLGKEHPEMNFRIMKFYQLPGQLARGNKSTFQPQDFYIPGSISIPLYILRPEIPILTAIYYHVINRFNEDREYLKYIPHDLSGTSKDWNWYRTRFDIITAEAQAAGHLSNAELKDMYKELSRHGYQLREDGTLELITLQGERVGLTQKTIRESNSIIAFKVLWAAVNQYLNQKPVDRPLLPQFSELFLDLERAWQKHSR